MNIIVNFDGFTLSCSSRRRSERGKVIRLVNIFRIFTEINHISVTLNRRASHQYSAYVQLNLQHKVVLRPWRENISRNVTYNQYVKIHQQICTL